MASFQVSLEAVPEQVELIHVCPIAQRIHINPVAESMTVPSGNDGVTVSVFQIIVSLGCTKAGETLSICAGIGSATGGGNALLVSKLGAVSATAEPPLLIPSPFFRLSQNPACTEDERNIARINALLTVRFIFHLNPYLLPPSYKSKQDALMLASSSAKAALAHTRVSTIWLFLISCDNTIFASPSGYSSNTYAR